MIVKVQGGGKVYANTGSCSDVVSYLQHEDAERLQAGLTPEPFFNQEQNRISPKEVTNKIDNNRKGLKAKEAKFYVITVAPSREELRKMGATKEEQAAAMKVLGAAGSGKSESIAVPLLSEFVRMGFAGVVYDFKFPTLAKDVQSFVNAKGSVLRHFYLDFNNPAASYRVNPLNPLTPKPMLNSI